LLCYQEYFTAQSTNTRLSYELKQLEKEKNGLQADFENHLTICLRNAEEYVRQSTLHLPSSVSNPITYWVQTMNDVKQDVEYLEDSSKISLFDEGSCAASMTPESSREVIPYATPDIINTVRYEDIVSPKIFSKGACTVSSKSLPTHCKMDDASSSDVESVSPDSSPSHNQTVSSNWYNSEVLQRQTVVESVDVQSPMLPLCVSYINEQWSTTDTS